MAKAAVVPRVRVMTICDHVEASETEANVFDLLDVRYELRVDSFPYTHPELWVYVLLSCARTGVFPGYLQILNDQTDKVIFLAKIRPQFDAPETLVPVCVPIRCSFPQAGRYTFQVSFFQKDFGRTDIVKGEMSFAVFD